MTTDDPAWKAEAVVLPGSMTELLATNKIRVNRRQYLSVICSNYLGLQLAAVMGPLGLFVMLGLLAIYVNVTIKRVHDLGLTGWFCLLLGLPLISLILIVLPGSKQENRYGPPVKPAPMKAILYCWAVSLLAVAMLIAYYFLIVVPAWERYRAASGF